MNLNKPVIKVKFVDFWPEFDLPNFMFYQLLLEKYNVLISDKPELLFYSVYGNNHAKYNCTKIFFTAENVRPDFRSCDFAFTFDLIADERNYRLPLYAFYADINCLVNREKNIDETVKQKRKFCCFIVSNPVSKIRNDFFKELSELKHVDSGGSLYNNVGGLVEDKRAFIKDYKFVIAFENTSYPGYVTEKILEPFLENCIPIYWGNPLINQDFNSKSFINCHDFASFDDVMKHVLEIDADDEKYMQYLNEPVFKNDELTEFVKKDNIVKRLDEIVIFYSTRTKRIKKYQKLRPLYCFINLQFKKLKNRFRIIFNSMNVSH